MSYRKDLSLIKRGSIRWNAWREKYPRVVPNLKGIDRSGEDHSRFDLRFSNLSSASFNQADLSEADLSDADLSEANFSKANLSGANLSRADLSGSDFSGADLRDAKFQGAYLTLVNFCKADLRGADFHDANFNGANFSQANLSDANFSRKILSGSDFTEADLSRIDLSHATLIKTTLSRATLTEANLSEANLSNSDFRQVDLREANLRRADLSRSNLEGADLREASFIRTQALGTNFSRVNFTGVCIEDWNINGKTSFLDINCQYIYLKSDEQERRPHSGLFEAGEFAFLIQESVETVDLIFADGINWKAFFQAFQELQSQYPDNLITVKAIEKKSDEAFVIRLEVPPGADKMIIEARARELYENDLQALEAQYREKMQAKDRELLIYRQQSTDLIEIIKLQANRPINIEARAVAESKSDSDTYNNNLQGANIGNFANQLKDSARQQANQHNYDSSKEQTLAEAATEIQRLLKQLEKTNPDATETEKITYINVASKPELKQRVVAALKSGGDTAIDEFFLGNKYLKVGKAVVKAWLQPDS